VRRGVPAVALLLAMAACHSTSDEPAPPKTATSPSNAPSAAAARSYVALGDSFTAGPGITPQRADAGLCQRAEQNWPAVLAASRDLDVRDVSCTGATTADVAATVASGAVAADPDLVTISTGGNDGGLFVGLIRACTTGGDACRLFVEGQAPGILDTTTSDLTALLEQVQTAAPAADLVLVGYPRIMPDDGTCDAVRLPASDVALAVRAEVELDQALASAANRAGVQFISLRTASEGHDACAGGEAWTNGLTPATGDGIVFHPNRRGMAAVADAVAAGLR